MNKQDELINKLYQEIKEKDQCIMDLLEEIRLLNESLV